MKFDELCEEEEISGEEKEKFRDYVREDFAFDNDSDIDFYDFDKEEIGDSLSCFRGENEDEESD